MFPRMTGRPPTPADGEPLLLARDLVRRYRRTVALQGVDVRLEAGESVALLGPNGAGKTTLLRLLAGVAEPSSGTVRWRVPRGVTRSRVGWVPQRPALYSRLTARENLRLFARLEGVADPEARIGALLARADLERFADRPAHELSTGTLQRLNIAVALAGDPAALLLDEPSATLSPDQRVRLWEWLTELRRRDGLALVFSTQSVDEAARHAGRTLVVVDGRVAFGGTVAEMAAAHAPEDVADEDAAETAFLRLVEGRS
jgi:ABC-2 type transport system ATP-binding protein